MKEKEFIHALQQFVFEYEKEHRIEVIQFSYQVKCSYQLPERNIKQLDIMVEIEDK